MMLVRRIISTEYYSQLSWGTLVGEAATITTTICPFFLPTLLLFYVLQKYCKKKACASTLKRISVNCFQYHYKWTDGIQKYLCWFHQSQLPLGFWPSANSGWENIDLQFAFIAGQATNCNYTYTHFLLSMSNPCTYPKALLHILLILKRGPG